MQARLTSSWLAVSSFHAGLRDVLIELESFSFSTNSCALWYGLSITTFVTSDKVRTLNPTCRAAITSGTVLFSENQNRRCGSELTGLARKLEISNERHADYIGTGTAYEATFCSRFVGGTSNLNLSHKDQYTFDFDQACMAMSRWDEEFIHTQKLWWIRYRGCTDLPMHRCLRWRCPSRGPLLLRT